MWMLYLLVYGAVAGVVIFVFLTGAYKLTDFDIYSDPPVGAVVCGLFWPVMLIPLLAIGFALYYIEKDKGDD